MVKSYPDVARSVTWFIEPPPIFTPTSNSERLRDAYYVPSIVPRASLPLSRFIFTVTVRGPCYHSRSPGEHIEGP